jgi:outer membrane protein OmpA-like peptidoglycan-associated protein
MTIRTTALRRWGLSGLTLALAGSAAACGTGAHAAQEQAPGALAIVLGAHSNMPHPQLVGNAAQVRDLAVSQQSYLSVFVADGAPYQVTHQDLLPDADNHGGAEEDEPVAEQIAETLKEARARTPEVDLMTAIDLAARDIAGKPGLHTLVVVDSDLATAGPLNLLTPGLLDAEPQEIADNLDDLGLLPNLSGDAVVFVGLGDTVAPQTEPDRARRTQLEAIWTAVAKKAGAVSVEVSHTPLSGQPTAGLPPVTPVPLDPGHSCIGGVLTLDGGDIAFEPGSDVFLDQEAAEGVLRPVADAIVGQRLKALIFGDSDSVGDLASQKKRSGLRAQHVADTFIRMGVPIPQLAVEGLGSAFDGFVPDMDPAGQLLPAAAAINRKVVVHLSLPDGRPGACP